jgi:hypothetical protein
VGRLPANNFGELKMSALAKLSADNFPSAERWRGRPMSSAPRDGTWILVRIQIVDENDRRHDVVTAAQYVAVHGGFCGLSTGGGLGNVQAPLSPYSWAPQPVMR